MAAARLRRRVLAGIGMLVGGTIRQEWGLVIIGGGWLMAGLLYLYVLRGKPAKPPRSSGC